MSRDSGKSYRPLRGETGETDLDGQTDNQRLSGLEKALKYLRFKNSSEYKGIRDRAPIRKGSIV